MPLNSIDSTLHHIVIAKSDRLYIEAIQPICTRVFPDAKIQPFTEGSKALEWLGTHDTQLMIMGLRFSDIDGLELLQQISRGRLVSNLFVLIGEHDMPLLPMLYLARLDAIVDTYNEGTSALRRALRSIADGKIYISPTLIPILVEDNPLKEIRKNMTNSELRILKIIGKGSDNEEAAQILGLSASTVQTHRRNIMRKLNVSSSAHLVHQAIRLGFVTYDRFKIPNATPA